MGLLQGFWGLLLTVAAVLNGWVMNRRGGWLLIPLTAAEALAVALLQRPFRWQSAGFTWVVLWLMSMVALTWFRKRGDGGGR